jgi:hypothetical protein
MRLVRHACHQDRQVQGDHKDETPGAGTGPATEKPDLRLEISRALFSQPTMSSWGRIRHRCRRLRCINIVVQETSGEALRNKISEKEKTKYEAS